MRAIEENLNAIKSKKVLVRCNFDVPVDGGKVVDTTRIEDAVSTIQVLTKEAEQVILIAHLGRPEGKYSEDKSLAPVAKVLEGLLSETVDLVPYNEDFANIKVESESKIVLLENLRYWFSEEKNDEEFSKWLASLADVYVNQSFANCHRAHASMVGVPKLLPSFAGLNLHKEVGLLDRVRNNPDKPLVVMIGGSKLETKEPLVEVFTEKADAILVGGKVALDLNAKHEQLPSNVMIAGTKESGRDIDVKSANAFAQKIMQAKTVIWNGTMGVFEEDEHQEGTRIVADAVNKTSAFTLVGGGDTETALTQLKLEEKIDFISSGGGAMLTFLSEGSLVALDALNDEK